MKSQLLRAVTPLLLALGLGLALPQSGMAREAGGRQATPGHGGKHHAGQGGKGSPAGKGEKGTKSAKAGDTGHGKGGARGNHAGKASPKPQGGAHSRRGSSAGKPSQGTGKRGPKPASGVPRDDEGRIARSARQKADFRQSNPCPATGRTTGPCPGYVVDHRVPLKRGGADAPGNMQWQTQDAARAKDRRE